MAAPPLPKNERVALVVATVASFLTPFMGSATNVALPSLGRELGMDAVTLSWVATAYLLSASVSLVPFGKLADLRGRKRVFVVGLLVHTTTSLLCGLAWSAPVLLAGRVAQGVGGGMIFGTNVALLSSAVPQSRRGAALGINVASVYLGLSLGPPLGGLLTEHLGWRSVFFVATGLGALAAFVAARGLAGEWAEAAGETFDAAGAILYGCGLGALVYGLGRLPAGMGATLVALGLATLAAFVAWEQRARSPLLDIRLFRENRVFAFSNLAALINYSATYAVTFLLSLYLQSVRGLTAQAAGAVLATQPLLQTIVSPVAGRLSDRIDPRVVASAGMGLITAALAVLGLADEPISRGVLIGCLAALGSGFGLFSSPNTHAVMGSVERHSFGVASATLAAMRLVGQMLSMGVAGLLLALFVGREPLSPERNEAFLAAMRTGFFVFSALCLAGTFASLARGAATGGHRGALGPRPAEPRDR